MNANKLPSLKMLNECFTVCGESRSGLIWKVRPREHFNSNGGWGSTNGNYAGKPAGNLWTDSRDPKSQYWTVMIQGVTYMVHRIVYSLAHSVILKADEEIDHIDTNGLNNSVSNIRLTDTYGNGHNKNINKRNTTGFKGVVWHNGWKAYYGRVCYKWKRYRTQPCPTPEMAAELLRELREQLHKEFTNHG